MNYEIQEPGLPVVDDTSAQSSVDISIDKFKNEYAGTQLILFGTLLRSSESRMREKSKNMEDRTSHIMPEVSCAAM